MGHEWQSQLEDEFFEFCANGDRWSSCSNGSDFHVHSKDMNVIVQTGEGSKKPNEGIFHGRYSSPLGAVVIVYCLMCLCIYSAIFPTGIESMEIHR